MDVLKLWFLLLLTLCDGEDFHVKRVGQKREEIPVCDVSKTMDFISLLMCKVRRERSSSEPCILIYQYDGSRYNFEQGCDSSFMLTGNNQTVFLLQHLTAADSLYITCLCSYQETTYVLHLNITVEDSEEDVGDLTTTNVLYVPVSVAVFLILTSVMLVFIHRKLHHRKQPDLLRNPPDMGDEDVESYSTFSHTDAGLYSVVQFRCFHTIANNSDTTSHTKHTSVCTFTKTCKTRKSVQM